MGPILAIVFGGFFVVGAAMPVLPLHVHAGLGFGTFTVGIVAGSQFAATLMCRFWAGRYTDMAGPRSAVLRGLVVAAASGVLYYLSLALADIDALASVALLVLGRIVLGAGESFVVSGALLWALARLGEHRAGSVLAWIGTAMYVSFAAGAPAGTVLYAEYGFAGLALATLAIPLAVLAIAVPLQSAPVQAQPPRAGYARVVAKVALPGLALALASIGFGAITAFVALHFAARGWGHAWIALTAVSLAFAGGRIALGHLPDRLGGLQVALASAAVEAVGQAIVWLAPQAAVALAGAALTGLGYALVFPGLGLEALRRARGHSRGLVMGAYTSFLDLTLGLGIPLLGLVAAGWGVASVFLASTLAATGAALVTAGMLLRLRLQARTSILPSR